MTMLSPFLRGAALLALLTLSPSRAAEAPFPIMIGADVSMAPKHEDAGIVFKDGGQPKDIFAIFKDHGATCIRLRLFVNPNGKSGVVNDVPYTMALAKRIKAAGLLFSLDLHYSDTWADPTHQITPAAWRDLTFPQLVDQVRDYTATTLTAFRQAGVTPDVVQIGNEITNGLLWPQGVIGGNRGHDVDFDHVADLLKAGVDGFHQALGNDTTTKIMIHVDGGDATNRVKWFFDGITARHVPFDMIGLSYYPFWSGPLQNLKNTLVMAAATYHKPIIVAETAYPFVDAAVWTGQRKSFDFPLTPQGQEAYLKALLRVVRETPDGLGAGVLYWYPESVPMHGDAKEMWNEGDSAMFDHDGNALPSFDAFRSQP